ncbi:MAG: hypothetical protein GY941_16785 [Planctomycetes bacterium]|nr:hypothetical protein [Planctomycetota bacterium]
MKKTIKLIRNILEKFNLIANLTVKNLALHQQLIVLNRSIKRPQIKTKDRLFWIILCGLDKDVPTERLIQPKPSIDSKIIKLPRVGGLHNRYQWKEAA